MLPDGEGVKVRARTAAATVRIDPHHGMLTPTLTAIFSADNGKAIYNISNIVGRTRSCTLEAAGFGFNICP